MIRPARGGGLLLVLMMCACAGSAQKGRDSGLRHGPHDVAVRRAAGGDLEVWYPASCGHRPLPGRPCADGTPDSGTFPLLVYAVAPGGADEDDSSLVTYFASHGYAVAWKPHAWSATAARSAAGTLPFVDSTHSALFSRDSTGAGRGAGTWPITVTAPPGGGLLRAAVSGSRGATMLVFRLPGAGEGRRLSAVVGHRLMDAVLRGWGALGAVTRQLDAMGLSLEKAPAF
jgi:hypothetical protein